MSGEQTSALTELKDEVKAAFSTRMRSPFVGVFVFSWIAWNHRTLFVLFADMKVGKRFGFIDEELYPSTGQFITSNLLLPLLSSVLYIGVVPWVTEAVHRWNLWMQRRLRQAEMRSEGLELLTEQQSVQLRERMARLHESHLDLQGKLAKQERATKRYAAMHAELSRKDYEVPPVEVVEYLLSDSFAAKAASDLGAELSVHSFDERGQVLSWKVSRDRSVMAERWSISGKALDLYSSRGEVIATFEFNPESAQFEGSANGRATCLVPRSL
ncbi:hypothetical protein [Stenotrophomonas sp. TWI587]|uniref:hypothetical protein n=1 Tax=Stenotrophomonas sp. TWI587 TaxID=3136783 RepID=UPI00320790D6